MPSKTIKQQGSTPPHGPVQPRPVEMQQYGTPFGQLKPRAPSYQPRPQQMPKSVEGDVQQGQHEQQQQQQPQLSQPEPPQHTTQNQIDPNLFSLYTQDDQDGPYQDSNYPYPGTDQPQPYHQRPQSSGYQIPSLEQIANEVLVDMSGPEPQETGQTSLERNIHLFQNASTAPMVNGHGHPPKPDESVDSAISLPPADAPTEMSLPNGHDNAAEETTAQPSVEPTEAKAADAAQPDERPQSSASKSGAHGLPLYQPPAPVSQSPEISKRQPALPNGVAHSASPPAIEANGIKRKRDSSSAVSTTASAKKAKMSFAGGAEQAIVEDGEADKESLELARMLQQEDRGLRRRS